MSATVIEKKNLSQRTTGGLHEYLYNTYFVDMPRNSRIIDVGCGTGAWLLRLVNSGFRSDMLTGVDLDAASFALENVDFHSFDLNSERWPVIAENANIITAIEVLEHLKNPGSFFHAISQMMSEKSVLLLTSPNISSLEARLRFFITGRLPQFDEKADPTHIFPVYIDCLERICENFGLEVFETGSYSAVEPSKRMYSYPIRLAAASLGAFLPNQTPGDIRVWLIRKTHT